MHGKPRIHPHGPLRGEGAPQAFTSPSLGPVLLGQESVSEGPIVSGPPYWYEPRVAVRWDRWKYIAWLMSGDEELYDLMADPKETVRANEGSPEALQKGRDLLREHKVQAARIRQQYGIAEGAASGQVDPSAMEQIKGLGYVR